MKRLDGLRILVVEDDYFIARDAADTIAAHGGIVAGPAADIASARALLDSDEPDGAIVDVNLEGNNARPLVADLRARDIPVIIMTGYAVPDMLGEYADLPRLTKPVTDEALVRCIAETCRR